MQLTERKAAARAEESEKVGFRDQTTSSDLGKNNLGPMNTRGLGVSRRQHPTIAISF